jgi:DNA-binding transcriptional LysR family regulator
MGTIRRVVCASPAYFAEHGTPAEPSELAAHPCISFEGLVAARTWTFASGKHEVAVAVHPRLIVSTAEAAVDAALAGVGITCVLSYQMAAAKRAGTLAVALEAFEPPPRPVSLVHAGQGLLPLKLRAFLDFAGPRLRRRLSEDVE